MNRPAKIQPAKRSTNVSLPAKLVDEAKAKGINLSEACEQGLRAALGEQWKRDNREALEWSNDYVEKHGLPLEKYRLF